MKYSENVINILTAKSYKGIGRAWIIKNLKGNETPQLIVSLLNSQSKQICKITTEDFESNKEWIIKKLNQLDGYADGAVAIGDKDFPKHRGNVKVSEQPIVLFYRGDLNLLQLKNKNIAVIGLLNPDPTTELIETKVVSELVKNGATIVSGLAMGCDTIAHKQAMISGGKTVAILPSTLNAILPATNTYLANEIVLKGGLLVTEYMESPKSRMELTGRYQERDRLQALFSDSIILSASYAKNDLGNDSGSRLAMEYALNYKIPRVVIYQPDIDKYNSKYDLNRQIIDQKHDNVMIISNENYLKATQQLLDSKITGNNTELNQADLF